jgi:putative radical SAM enzyme (TIGR03279 family)
MKILTVEPHSPLFGYIRPGYTLVSINGAQVVDNVDYRFKLADEQLDLCFADEKGKELRFQFDDISSDQLGITLDDHKIKLCKNDCIFCFVLQQPPGMRRALYLKDEDYRLSFTHGNFITLSNTSDEDLERIIEQRLSPLYVSVHVTDDTLRRCMLRNERLAPIIPRLKYLGDSGITIHTQAVLCPKINDGEYLDKTITELAALFPSVESLAVVPVGLTKFREHLPNLRSYTPEEASEIISIVTRHQKSLLQAHGTRFVWPGDEFYTIAGETFPAHSSYEEFQQFENGIGMCRDLLTSFNRRKKQLKGISSKKRILMLTGSSAYGFLSRDMLPWIQAETELSVSLKMVPNRFWGESVTVSGLLTGQDLLRAARTHANEYDVLLLPPNCLNNDDLFLDNLSLEQFRAVLPTKTILLGQYNMVESLLAACSSDVAVDAKHTSHKIAYSRYELTGATPA